MCEDCSYIRNFLDDLILTSDEEISVILCKWSTGNKKVLAESTFSNTKQEVLNQLPILQDTILFRKTQLQKHKFLKENLSEDKATLHEHFFENFNVPHKN